MYTVYLSIGVLLWCEYLILADRQHILGKRRDLSFSRNDLDIILNRTFPESRCCSVYLKQRITEEESQLLKLFVFLYKSEYFLNEGSLECRDYLFINMEDELLTKYIRGLPLDDVKARILVLILNSKINENSTLFNVTMYKSSFVNLVYANGVYSLNPKNYQKTFLKYHRYDQLKHHKEKIDLIGKELHVSTFYVPPFCFLKTTINQTIKGIPSKIFTAIKKKERDGIEFQLFLIIAKTLNFTYTLRAPSGRYNHGRKYNRTAWDGGMIGQVARKEVDIAFGDIWQIQDNLEFVSLSEPWSQVFIKFLVPRPQPYTSFWALTRPFSPLVWLIIALILVLKSIHIYCKALIDPLMPKRFSSFFVTLSEMFGRMLGTWITPVESSDQIRLQFVLWEITGFILVTLYCSSLAAKLTYPEFEDRIDSLKQFIEKNLTWGRMDTPPVFKEYFDLKDKYAKQMPRQFVIEQSVEDRIRRVLQRRHGVVGRLVGKVFYPEGSISNKALETLRVMDQTVGQFYTCFAVQPWLVDSINKIMMQLRESGIVQYHMKHVIHRRTGPHLYGVFVEHDRPEEDVAIVLTVNPLGAGFATLILGLIIAAVVFYREIQKVDRFYHFKLFKIVKYFKK